MAAISQVNVILTASAISEIIAASFVLPLEVARVRMLAKPGYSSNIFQGKSMTLRARGELVGTSF